MAEIIDRIEVWACTVPLPAPLHFGAFTVKERRYVALRVRAQSGVTADLIGHTRGSPVDVAISDLIAPTLVGTDALEIEARNEDFRKLTVATERDGVIGRAWSLVELALRGIAASAKASTLWSSLGGGARRGSSRDIPVQLIEGYALPGEADEAFAERLLGRVEEGYGALKVEGASYRDPAVLLRRLKRVRLGAPDCRLVVDFAWSWATTAEHGETIAALRDLEINWIEDAFPRDAIREYASACSRFAVSFGCGDEATRPADLLALVDGSALQVVRLDATALGGISVVLPLARELKARGRRVSYHDFPEIHEHCVRAGGEADHIEMFPNDRPFDVRHHLMQECAQQRVRNGHLTAAASPGLGTILELDAVQRHAVRYQSRGKQ